MIRSLLKAKAAKSIVAEKATLYTPFPNFCFSVQRRAGTRAEDINQSNEQEERMKKHEKTAQQGKQEREAHVKAGQEMGEGQYNQYMAEREKNPKAQEGNKKVDTDRTNPYQSPAQKGTD